MGCNNDDGNRFIQITDRLEQSQAVDSRHPQIGQDHIGLKGGKSCQSLFPAGGNRDFIILAFKAQSPQAKQICFIVDQKYLILTPHVTAPCS